MGIYVAVHEALRDMALATGIQTADKVEFVKDRIFCFKARGGTGLLGLLREAGITCNVVATSSLSAGKLLQSASPRELWRCRLVFDHQGKELAQSWYPDLGAESLEKQFLRDKYLSLTDADCYAWGICLSGGVLQDSDLMNAKRNQTWRLLSG